MESVTLVVDRSGYVLGQEAIATVTNRTDQIVMFAFQCDHGVEALADGEWRRIFKPDCSNVRVRPTRLGPGESAETAFAMEPCDAAGLDRFEAFRIELRYQLPDGTDAEARSASFPIAVR